MKQCYIAGRIRNDPDYRRKFSEAADRMRLEGWKVFNPAAANLDDGRPLHEIMSYCLMRLCESEAIALLPEWRRSGGARIEWLLARYLGLQIIYVH